MNERIKKILEELGLKRVDFANRLHISQPFASELCSGAKSPSERTISDICREFGVNESWLRTGDAPMFVAQSSDEQITAYVAKTLRGDNEFKKAVLSLLLSRSDEELAVIERAYHDLGTILKQRKGE